MGRAGTEFVKSIQCFDILNICWSLVYQLNPTNIFQSTLINLFRNKFGLRIYLRPHLLIWNIVSYRFEIPIVCKCVALCIINIGARLHNSPNKCTCRERTVHIIYLLNEREKFNVFGISERTLLRFDVCRKAHTSGSVFSRHKIHPKIHQKKEGKKNLH